MSCVYWENKGIDLQRWNRLLVLGNGENFSNCKQTSKSSRIKVISNDEFLPFHHLKFQISWITTFPTMIKHEKHIIDYRAKISENFNEFLHFLVKSLKIKSLHPMRRSMRTLSFKMRSLKGCKIISSTSYHEDFSSRQHSEAVACRCFTEKHLRWSLFLIKLQA